ncbi:MAG: response regulator [Deltaproteobacteria bacterium]|nr:response regulator [Deltaproteobacteria bacterium]
MPKKVLIADDTAFFRAVIKEILEKGGFEVVGEAVNGAEAVDKARSLLPDIVILDVVMPEKNGLDAAREIMRLKLPVKILMCTSLKDDPLVDQAMDLGACGYITKPLDEDKVLSYLNGLVT